MIQSLRILKKHWLVNIFSTSILCTFGIYIALEKKKDEIWELSFEWLLIYIIPFFILNLTSINNHYLQEIIKITVITVETIELITILSPFFNL